MKANQIKRVAVVLWLSFASHRDILHGISRYAKAHHWRLEFVPLPDIRATVRPTIHVDERINGLISCEDMPGLATPIAATNYPVVLVSSQNRSKCVKNHPLGLVNLDDPAIGAFGASYLHSLGKFRSFGFVPQNRANTCSLLRQRGFKEFLERKRCTIRIFTNADAADGTEADRAALVRWLRALPKPAAVMAAYDLRATQVLEAAQEARIAVPDQVSVIGTDNDDLLCDFTTPSLTSIAIDFVHVGELAAETLDRLMRQRGSRTISISSRDKRIVERESTRQISPSVSLVERALSYIGKNALSGINAADVVRHLGVSRRLADRRFREVHGSSILETILEIRLNELRNRLASSKAPIGELSHVCGFRNENHAKSMFKKHFGLTMRQFRNARPG